VLILLYQEILGDCGRAAIQTQGSMNNPFGSTLVYGYQNIAFEVVISYLAPQTSFSCTNCIASLLLLRCNIAILVSTDQQVMKNGYIATVTLFQS
jgi:hypothetical protein